MTSPDLDHAPAFITAPDGSTLAARHMGEGPGMPLLVVNAIGAGLASWRSTLIPLASEGPIVMWDLRGTLESPPPLTDDYGAEVQAADAIAVMDHFGYRRFVMASWSSGGRIALQIAAAHPDRVSALARVSAGDGYPLTRLLRYVELQSILPSAAGLAKRFAGPLQGALRGFVARPELAGLVRQSGMISASADISALVELVQGLSKSDLKTLLTTYEAVVGDPAPALMQEIKSATLLVVGERDQFTSHRMIEEMLEQIPGSRSLVYPGATHFLPMENPADLAEDLSSFFTEVV